MEELNKSSILNKLNELIAEYRALGIRDQIDYDKLYLYSIITHSTAIEGSTATEIENQLLFDEGISSGKPMLVQLMNLDLRAAYDEAFKLAHAHTDITSALLCKLSGMVMKNTGSVYNTIAGSFSGANGDLRRLNVSAGRGGRSYMAWQKVPGKLEEFCAWLNEERRKFEFESEDFEEIYRLSFLSHYHLVSIHPWADGNGRMARLLMNMIQVEFGLIPSIVKRETRVGYIESLSEAQQSGNTDPFLKFMMEHHIRNLEEQIAEYHASMENDDF